jgi:hypothetical protein
LLLQAPTVSMVNAAATPAEAASLRVDRIDFI